MIRRRMVDRRDLSGNRLAQKRIFGFVSVVDPWWALLTRRLNGLSTPSVTFAKPAGAGFRRAGGACSGAARSLDIIHNVGWAGFLVGLSPATGAFH